MRISDWSSDVCSSDLLPAADFGVRRSTLHDFIEVDSPCRSFRQMRRRDAPHVFHAAVTNGNRLFPNHVTAVLDLIDERPGIRLKVRRSLLDGMNLHAIDGPRQESGHAGGCDEATGAQD